MNMNTSPQKPKSVLLETRYVWGESLPDAMNMATMMQRLGWTIEGTPAPMTWNGRHGTGVAITRVSND